MRSLALALPLLASPGPSSASVESINTQLAAYQLPPILFTPPGFVNLVSEFGRGTNPDTMTNPLLVQFAHPSLWVEQRPSLTNNGEAGALSANDYIKGDSAFFFTQNSKQASQLGVDNKGLIREFVLKALSQKGDPVDSLKILSVTAGRDGFDGQKYVIADFGYQLNTQAGFVIDRRAVLALTALSPGAGEGQLQGLIAVSTDKRFKQLGGVLRQVADSFRVYKLSSGVFATK